MRVFFQTSRQRSFLSACRIAGKKWSASVPLLLAALLTVVFYSCRDEDLTPSMLSFEQGGTRAETPSTSGLDVVQDATYGATYKPNRRVPLVGEGRVINQITDNLVGVLSSSDNKLEYLVDNDLTNSVSLTGLAEVNTGLPILSVKDVNRVYYDSSNGIKVGFLYKDPGGLLSLNVLQGFWVKTYLKGKEQDGSSTSGSGDNFQLLNLNLLNVSGGLSEISFTTTKPFDEVRIGCASISVDVLSGLEFYYAFVGDNPKKIAAKDHEYSNAKQEKPDWNLTDVSGRNLVDSDISNGPTCELFSGLGGGLTCRVDFGATIPVGSEVGYYTTGGGLASITLGKTELNAYDTTNKNPQSINTESGIGVSALAKGAREFSMILIKENARRLELDLPAGINLLSAVQVHYAYSRDPVEIDVSSYFTIGNDTISTDYYDLPTPSDGTVIYSLISSPKGATSPSISGNRITGMTVMVTM